MIHIAISTDNNYAQHTGALMSSIISNTKSEVMFHILHTGLSHKNMKRLSRIGNIDFVEMDSNKFSKLPLLSYLTLPTYFRLNIGKVFPNIKKMIYLDCDIIVTLDIKHLWDMDIKSFTIGAAKDYFAPFYSNKDKDKVDKEYFNAGVLLIDLESWRKKRVYDRSIKLLKNNKLKFHDQDALNLILKDEWKELPARFNYGPFNRHVHPIYKDKPRIIHFAGIIKPWNRLFISKDRRNYLKYLKKTPWKDQVPEISIDIGPLFNLVFPFIARRRLKAR